MECKDCKFYKLLENGHHGQCVVVPEKHTVVHPYSCQCTEFEKREEKRFQTSKIVKKNRD